MTAFMQGIVAGYGIAIPVGAIAVLIIDAAMTSGFRQGFAAGAGAASADLTYAILAASAGALLSSRIATIAPLLRSASGVVLIALALRGLLALRRSHSSDASAAIVESGVLRTFGRFVVLTLLNPMTVIYFAAWMLASGTARQSAAGLVAFALGAFVASLSWQTMLAVAGSLARSTLPPYARVATGVTGQLIVLGFGIVALR